jgi:4-hydroxy-3-methylbut-2-en-1-yl diphosphate reductase
VQHEIVHNAHEVESPKTKGARFVESLADLPVLGVICPLVAKVHVQGEHHVRQGWLGELIGYAGHPEVVATMGRVPGPAYRVQTEEDAPAPELAVDTPRAYVTQTTLSIDDIRSPTELLGA